MINTARPLLVLVPRMTGGELGGEWAPAGAPLYDRVRAHHHPLAGRTSGDQARDFRFSWKLITFVIEMTAWLATLELLAGRAPFCPSTPPAGARHPRLPFLGFRVWRMTEGRACAFRPARRFRKLLFDDMCFFMNDPARGEALQQTTRVHHQGRKNIQLPH